MKLRLLVFFLAIISIHNFITAQTPVSGTKTVCPSGCNFTTLSRAFDTITTNGLGGAVILELKTTYVSTSEVFPLNVPTNGTSTNTITIRPEAAVSSALSITSTNATTTLNLSGSKYVTFDGRNGGTGSNKYLNILNASTGLDAPAIIFQNDAVNNTFRYCTIQSRDTNNTEGTIFFATTSGTTGNDDNTIDNCTVNDNNTTNTPVNAIYSRGTVGKENSGVTISNCWISNFYRNSSITLAGVFADTGSTQWTISNNRFYQTTTRNPSATPTMRCIYATSGNGYVITGNIIGYATATGTGLLTLSTPFNFRGISLLVGSSSATSVQNNTITAISHTSAAGGTAESNAPFVGIQVLDGWVNIGTSIKNTIGSLTSNTITLSLSNATVNATPACGISVAGNSTDSIANNEIGGITQISSGNRRVSLVGIRNNSTGSVTIYNNTIGGLVTNSMTQIATLGQLIGILSTQGTANIRNNTIQNLTHTGPNVGQDSAASVIGISLNNTTTGGQTIYNNTIIALGNSNFGNGAYSVIGLRYQGSTSGTNTVSSNYIRRLNVSAAGTTGVIEGLKIVAGTTTFSNNSIIVGTTQTGSSITKPIILRGISEAGGNNSIYFNSVYVHGTGALNNVSTYAFYGTSSTGTRIIKNNSFSNGRTFQTTNPGFGNYAFALNGTVTGGAISGLSLDNNLYNSTDTLLFRNPIAAGTDYTSLTAWKAVATAYDAGSVSGDPKYNSRDSHKPLVSTALVAGVSVSGITTDIVGVTRTINRMGAYETTGETSAPDITHVAALKTSSTSDRTLTARIRDTTGVPLAVLTPQLYYKKNSGSYQKASGVLSSGNMMDGIWSFTLSSSAMSGLTAGDTVSYYIVAQDLNTYLGSNPEGVVASDVNTITTAPTNLNKYKIVDAASNLYTICDTCDFQSLTESGSGGLFEALNSSVLASDLTVYVYQSTDETGVTDLSGDALGGYRLSIRPGFDTTFVIANSVNLAQAMIRLNNASRVTFDGAYNGVGRKLRFVNTHTTAGSCMPIFSIDNSSTYDTITNCIIESNATNSARYPIVIGQTGNQNNIVISKNLIRGSVGSPGTIGSTVGAILCNSLSNKKITVGGATSADGNEITDFLTNGIFFQLTGDSNTISNNKIYRGIDRNAATNCISITSGVRHTISNNSIGGNSTNRSGTAFTIRGANTLNGILANLGNSDSSYIQNNTISNFGTANDVDATIVNAISVTGGLVNITNNTIGGGAAAYDTIRGASTTTGISVSGTGTYIISGNTIGNFNHYRTATADGMWGIYVNSSTATYSITSNTIRNLLSNSNTTTTASHAIGIYVLLSSSTGNHTISQNTIHGLQNKQTIADVRTAGIRLTSSSATSCSVDRNRIYNLTNPNTTTTHSIWGILVTGNAPYTLSNNMVALNPTNGQCAVSGISITSTSSTQNVFYNNVYIGGSASSGSAKSYGFSRTGSPTNAIRNNIFYNERTGGSGGHFAAGVASTTGLTISNNVLITANATTVAELVTTAYTFAGFNSSAGQTNARNGLSTNYASATFFSSTSTGNLTSAECITSNAGTPVASTIDYNNTTRSLTTPDIGANEFATIQNIWTGVSSTDFNEATNWCAGAAPGVNDTFTIANTSNKPQLSANTTLSSLLIQSGTRLDLNGYQLTINGTLSGTGVVRGSTTSRLIIGGTGALGSVLVDQTTPGTTNVLSMLQLNRGTSPATGSATISGALQIVDSLTLTNGTLNTGGNLTLLSTSTKTAQINTMNTANAAITGNIIAQRFIESAGRRWRFLGSPVSGTTVEDWRGEIHITGPGTGTTLGTTNSNGFDATLSNLSSIYRYDETVAGNQNSGWVTPSNTSESFTTGRGYRVFVRGPRTDGNGLLDGTISSQNAVTLNLTGTANTGNITMPVSYTASGGAANDGWCLLANPYASQISWNSIYDDVTARTNLNPVIYVLDAVTLNAYVSYNAASDIGTLTNGVIPSGGAFLVQTTGASPALTIKETHKVSTLPGSYNKQTNNPFSIKFNGSLGEGDVFLLKPMAEATPFKDVFDIPKLNNSSFNISGFGADEIKLSADCRPFTNDTVIIPLYIQTSAVGKVYFDVDGVDAIPSEYTISLLDKKLSTNTPINGETRISFDATSDTSFNTNRFTLVFTKAPQTGIATVSANAAAITCFPNPFSSSLHIAYTHNLASMMDVQLYDLTGKLIQSMSYPVTSEGKIDINTEDLSHGVYILSVSMGKNQTPVTYRIVK